MVLTCAPVLASAREEVCGPREAIVSGHNFKIGQLVTYLAVTALSSQTLEAKPLEASQSATDRYAADRAAISTSRHSPPQARSSALPHEVRTSVPLHCSSLKRTTCIDEHSQHIQQSQRSLPLSSRRT